jgi:hypothetical protein
LSGNTILVSYRQSRELAYDALNNEVSASKMRRFPSGMMPNRERARCLDCRNLRTMG